MQIPTEILIMASLMVLAIMLLGVTCGTQLDLLVTGDDELDARDAIIELINSRFGEAE